MDNEKRFFETLDIFPVPVALHDFERFVYINSACMELFNAPSSDAIVGLPILDFVHESSFERAVESLKIGYEEKLYELKEMHLLTKDGRSKFCDISGSFLTIEGRELVFILINDVTERKAQQELLTKAKDLAEEMNALKTNFLLNMSHELRTPMIGIVGFSELLEEYPDDPEVRYYGKMIQAGSNRLMETIDKIFTFSSIVTGNLPPVDTVVDPLETIKAGCQLFEYQLAKSGISLGFYSNTKSFTCLLDKVLFARSVENILSNAVKFTKSGGIKITLEVLSEDNTHKMNIAFEDTGIGLAKENLVKIFKEFRQDSEGIGRHYEGTGLGLTIAKKLVEEMGGEIAVRSTLGVGSCFTISLPIKSNSFPISEESHLIYEYPTSSSLCFGD